jgi:predicted transcriptional regulator YdeE
MIDLHLSIHSKLLMMGKVVLEEINLIGLPLNKKTTNANGQSAIDCGSLWEQFEKENYYGKIPGKLTEEILAVYHDYESDFTGYFSYFIGCKVAPGTEVPVGLEKLTISAGEFEKIVAQGQIPDCIADAWKTIWMAEIPRAYLADFEIYDDRSKDWRNGTIDIYLSIK